MNSRTVVLAFFTLNMSLGLSQAPSPPQPPALPAPPPNAATNLSSSPVPLAATVPAVPPFPDAATNAPGPKIEFATPVYDFGKIKSGDPVKYTYYFTNTGGQVLEVTHVQPSCGCTTAGEYSKRVEPGATGIIPIQFNSANFSGSVFKTIAVNSTARNQNAVTLQLKGTIWKPIEFIPSYPVLDVPPDVPSASTVVRITNNLEEPLMVFDPHCSNPAFTAELKTNTPGKGFELTISASRPLATGTAQGQVTLKTSSTNTPTITATFWANVRPAVMVFPAQVTLASGPLTNKATPSVTIQNNSTNALTLSEATVNVPGVDVQVKELQPGRIFTAMLTFPEGFQVPQGQQAQFTAKSSNPQMPLIKVPILQMPRPVSPPPVPPAASVPTAQVNSTPASH